MTSFATPPGSEVPPRDPMGELWNDDRWVQEYFAELAADFVAEYGDGSVDEAALHGEDAGGTKDDHLTGHDGSEPSAASLGSHVHQRAADLGLIFDHELASELDELGETARAARVLAAERYRRIARVLRNAASEPEPWVGPDPTVLPGWVDPRGRTTSAVRRDRVDIAVRAAAADIAARLRLTESAVRTQAAHADILLERAPRVWEAFLAGDVPESHIAAVAQAAESLPDDPVCWESFDERASAVAVRLSATTFRAAIRSIRERVHPEKIDERHRRATEARGVWITGENDGMATISALLPAARARAAMNRLDAIARNLRRGDDESRTLAQLRADAFGDLLVDGTIDEKKGGAVTATVAITVSALTLLGTSDEPATLEGYGPIDLATAKKLAGSATSWLRILTHPLTGVPLALDRTRYRVPLPLRRWLGVEYETCNFFGCLRLARDCEIDHRFEWRDGGTTDAANLGPECKPHHRVKTESLWKLHADPETGEYFWTSPTGFIVDPDPPPF